MSLPGGTSIGKYVVRRKIAEGGMAEIYLASSRGPEGFEKDVVIKRVRPVLANDPEFVQMFISEARVASRLNHANLVHIFDFDKHDDTYYLAMEYVRGKSLWELRKRCKELMEPVPPTLCAQLGVEVARGLFFAHRLTEKGKPLALVHRDVTPHNILLSYDGAVKLTDFGIAKAGNRLTASGMLKGKFAYMAPEQARGEAVDARTDIFALGIVLWELLTGGRLFEGDSDLAVLRAVQTSAIAPPARLNPEVDEKLDAVIMTALSRDPAQRFATAQDFERALAQCVLSRTKSIEDTDVGAFVRRMFAEPGLDRELSGEATYSESVPRVAEPVAAPAPRESTAILSVDGVEIREVPSDTRAERSTPAAKPSPDEDLAAETLVFNRARPPSREPSLPPLPPPRSTPALAVPERPDSTASIAVRARSRTVPLAVGAVCAVVLVGAIVKLAPRATAPQADPLAASSASVQPHPAAPPPAEVAAPTVAVATPAAPVTKDLDAGHEAALFTRPKHTTVVPAHASLPETSAPRGTLTVRIAPYGYVRVDGREPLEVEGQRKLSLSYGPHHVLILDRNHAVLKTETVSIGPGGAQIP